MMIGEYSPALVQDSEFFYQELPRLLQYHPGEWVVVSRQRFLGVYPSFDDAQASVSDLSPGTYLIKQIVAE